MPNTPTNTPRICALAASGLRVALADPDSEEWLGPDQREDLRATIARLETATNANDPQTQADLCEAWEVCSAF